MRTNVVVNTFSTVTKRSTGILNASVVNKLDSNTAANSPLDAGARSKLMKGLEPTAKAPIHPSEIGMMETQASAIAEALENALDSKALHGIFKEVPMTADLINIKNVKVNRDLSHVDVVWGSELFENLISQAHEKFGETEAKTLADRIYKTVTNTLQRKESKFRTYLMHSMEFRRVPRIFFAPPTLKALGAEVRAQAIAEWVKEEEARQRERGSIHYADESDSNSGSSDRSRSRPNGSSESAEEVDNDDEVSDEEEFEQMEGNANVGEQTADKEPRLPLDVWMMTKPDGMK